jgi:transcriptional regulator with XRE-family HTH domain
MINPSQCRAARALLNWSQQDLADASKIGNATIRNFEGGKSTPQHATLDVLVRAFQSAGVTFLANGEALSGGPGVRFTE